MQLPALLILISAIATPSGHAAAIDKYKAMSSAELIARADDYDRNAIRELGRRQERTAIPVLKRIAEDKKNFDMTRHRAQIALAQLEVGDYFERFSVGLSSGPAERVEAINNLGEIANKRAIDLLIPVLDDHRKPYPRRPGGDVIFPGYSQLALSALMDNLPDVFEQLRAESNGKGVFLSDWKKMVGQK